MLGGIATWFAQAPHRREERHYRRETERLHRELEVARRARIVTARSLPTISPTPTSRAMADPLIIKICGIKTPRILEAAIDAGADMVGFMHFARSPRHVDIEPLQRLISAARGRIETCVVLVNPDNSTRHGSRGARRRTGSSCTVPRRRIASRPSATRPALPS